MNRNVLFGWKHLVLIEDFVFDRQHSLVKEAFLKASDENFLRRIGKVWSDYELGGIERLKTYKKKHIVLDQTQTAEFESALEPVIDRWIMEVRSKGIDGKDLVQKARALVQKHSK